MSKIIYNIAILFNNTINSINYNQIESLFLICFLLFIITLRIMKPLFNMKKYILINLFLGLLFLDSCEKEGRLVSEFDNIIITSEDLTLQTKNKYEIYVEVAGDKEHVVIYPQFMNDLHNSTTPVHLHLWNAFNLKGLSFDQYLVMGSEVSNKEEFVGHAVYQHLLPRFYDTGYPTDIFWTDDIYATDFDKENYNIPLSWEWGDMMMKYMDDKPAIVFNLSHNDTGYDRSIVLLIGLVPEYTYISVKQKKSVVN